MAKETRFLKCDLTNQEIIDLSVTVANIHIEKADKEAAKKAAASAFKAEIEGLENQIETKSRTIRDGHEYRTIEVKVIEEDWESRVRTLARKDTGETFTETILQHETQTEMEV